MTNGRKPLSAKVTGRPRMPVPSIDAIETKSKSIDRQREIFSSRTTSYRIENNIRQCDKDVLLNPWFNRLSTWRSMNKRMNTCQYVLWEMHITLDNNR